MISQRTAFRGGTLDQCQQFFYLLNQLGEKALSTVILDGHALQRLIEQESTFQHRMILAIKELAITGEFADEELGVNDDYSACYHYLMNIDQQLSVLQKYFPHLVTDKSLKILEQYHFCLPAGAQGFFVIPHWSKVGHTYQAATKKVLHLLKEAYGEGFTNHRKYQLNSNRFCETLKKASNMEALYSIQKGDLFLLPAQFSFRHHGRSARRACAVMNDGEFGLGVYEIGIMLLTHPHRLHRHGDLWIDCSGDQFSLNSDDYFDAVPVFGFYGSGLRFDAHKASVASWRYASASGFALSPV